MSFVPVFPQRNKPLLRIPLDPLYLSERRDVCDSLTLFPNFNDTGDYRFQGHLGLQAALNRHLGLRLGYDLKYDHEPVKGFGTTDTATTAALVVQLGRKAL